MAASLLIHGGALLALLGALSLAVPRWRRARWRPPVLAICAGAASMLLGAELPARDVIVVYPRRYIDAVIPRYLFRELHVVSIAATPLAVDSALRSVTADDIRFYRALTWLRRLGRKGPEGLIVPPRRVPMLELATRSGFHVLSDQPGLDIVLGVAGPVSAAARAASTPGRPRPFTAAADGYASIVMNFHIEPDANGGTLLSTETRVFAPDPATRRSLTRYWRVILPGSGLIRHGWLEAVHRRALARP